MGKLRLKRTPAEEHERELRKARKAAKRAAKLGAAAHAHVRGQSNDSYDTSSFVFDVPSNSHMSHLNDSEDEYGPQPAETEPGPSTTGADYARILAELEEKRFKEKLADAMDADAFEDTAYTERLDSVESRMNAYAHVPRRWQRGSRVHMERGFDDNEQVENPNLMEDEEYTEWVRQGMWRRTHAAEVEELERKEKAKADRKRREKELKEEGKRLAREADEARRRRRAERTVRRAHASRDDYEKQWKTLLSLQHSDPAFKSLRFEDVPWPVFPSTSEGSITLEDITVEALALFLLPASSLIDTEEEKVQKDTKRKDKLRETMLRYHPDKFEARVLAHVKEADRESVRDGMGCVTRGIGVLMKQR